MERILLLVHTESDGGLSKAALEAVASAKALSLALGSDLVTVGLVGENVTTAADLIATCGAKRFLGVSGLEFSQSRYGTDATACEAICRAASATLIVAPGTRGGAAVGRPD